MVLGPGSWEMSRSQMPKGVSLGHAHPGVRSPADRMLM